MMQSKALFKCINEAQTQELDSKFVFLPLD